MGPVLLYMLKLMLFNGCDCNVAVNNSWTGKHKGIKYHLEGGDCYSELWPCSREFGCASKYDRCPEGT